MRHVISTACLGGIVEEKLRAAAAAGFDGVEIADTDLFCFDGDPRDLRRLAADLGLSVETYQTLRGFDRGWGPGFDKDLARAEHALTLAQALGAGMLAVQACSINDGFAYRTSKTIDHAHDLAERAARRGIRIAYGGMLRERYEAPHLGQLLDLAAEIDHPNFGVVVNTLDNRFRGDMAELVARAPSGRIFLLQTADAAGPDDEVSRSPSRLQCLPGQGELELQRLVAAAIANGYLGPISVDVASDELRELPAQHAAQDAFRSLQLLEEQVRRAPHAGSDIEPAHEVALFDPPAPVAARGISFLEFAVDPSMETKLADWLSLFGFTRTGVHHEKAVTLHEAGNIRIVLNAEPASFAQAFYRFHGVSVCNLGLSVDGARHAMARALAFGCPRFDERRSARDAHVDAVRVSDGSLLSFVESSKETELFRGGEFGETSPAPEGPSGVDHLVLALPRGELDSWLLLFRAVLGLSASRRQSLSDPYGTVRSRALVNEARTVRLALNVSDSRRTETAQSIAANVGASTQQIAFCCDDLIGFAKTLKRLGAPILHIPANYYDHLQETAGLERGFVEELRSLNVLYDRAGEGEFLHCYSESFDGRFFFEFVERRGGYDEYGSRNTPFRLAAQARVRLRKTPALAL